MLLRKKPLRSTVNGPPFAEKREREECEKMREREKDEKQEIPCRSATG